MNQPPNWLRKTADRVATQIHGADFLAPIGCHYYHDEPNDIWEVTLFVSPTETVGGEFDGRLTPCRFHVDLAGLEAVFSKVERFSWQAVSMGPDDDLGPHLAVEGKIADKDLWLRIVSHPPVGFEAGRVADAYDGEIRDRW